MQFVCDSDVPFCQRDAELLFRARKITRPPLSVVLLLVVRWIGMSFGWTAEAWRIQGQTAEYSLFSMAATCAQKTMEGVAIPSLQ